MANHPKPTKQKKLEGTDRPDRVNRNEPEPTTGLPECPDWLLAEARREWVRITTELVRLGMLTLVDRAMLAIYCQLWGRYVQAERRGKPVPAHHIQQIRGLAASFGLTPADRVRLSVKPEEEPDEFTQLLREHAASGE